MFALLYYLTKELEFQINSNFQECFFVQQVKNRVSIKFKIQSQQVLATYLQKNKNYLIVGGVLRENELIRYENQFITADDVSLFNESSPSQ